MANLHVIIGEDDYLVTETAKRIIGDERWLEVVDSLNSTNEDLQLADLREADLRAADLSNADLSEADFTEFLAKFATDIEIDGEVAYDVDEKNKTERLKQFNYFFFHLKES